MYLQACVSSLYTCLTDVRMNLRWKPRSVPSLNDWVQVKGTTSSKVTGPVSRVPDSYSSWLQSCGAGFILSRSVRSSPFSVLLTLFFVGKTSSRFYKNFSSWFFYVSDDFSSDFFFFFWLWFLLLQGQLYLSLGVSSFCFKKTKQPQPGSPKPWAEALCLKTDCSSSSQTILLVNQARISKPSLTPALLSTFCHWIPASPCGGRRRWKNKIKPSNKQNIPCQKWGGLASHGSVTTSVFFFKNHLYFIYE